MWELADVEVPVTSKVMLGVQSVSGASCFCATGQGHGEEWGKLPESLEGCLVLLWAPKSEGKR